MKEDHHANLDKILADLNKEHLSEITILRKEL
jgi:hypothetical protein